MLIYVQISSSCYSLLRDALRVSQLVSNEVSDIVYHITVEPPMYHWLEVPAAGPSTENLASTGIEEDMGLPMGLPVSSQPWTTRCGDHYDPRPVKHSSEWVITGTSKNNIFPDETNGRLHGLSIKVESCCQMAAWGEDVSNVCEVGQC